MSICGQSWSSGALGAPVPGREALRSRGPEEEASWGLFILVSFSVEGTMSSLLWSPTWGMLTTVTTVPTSGVLQMENGSASTIPMFVGWEASSQTAPCPGCSISNGFWARTGRPLRPRHTGVLFSLCVGGPLWSLKPVSAWSPIWFSALLQSAEFNVPVSGILGSGPWNLVLWASLWRQEALERVTKSGPSITKCRQCTWGTPCAECLSLGDRAWEWSDWSVWGREVSWQHHHSLAT